MRATWVIAANDLRRRLRDRSFFIQGIVAPLAFAVIIGFAFGGGFNFKATIGVADADGSELSRQLVSGLTGADQSGPVHFVAVAPDAVDARLSGQGGEAIDAAIVIPAGFGAVTTGASPKPLGVVVDADKRITADVTTAIAQRIADRLDTSRLAVASALAAGPQPPDAARVAEVAAQAQRVEVPVDLVHEHVAALYSPVAYFAPSMAMLFLFFTIGAGARSLVVERREGTLARVRSAPVRDSSILLGKTAAVLVFGLASLLVVWAVTSVGFRASWGDPLAVLAVIVGVVLATAGISLLVTGLARTEAQAEGVTTMVAFVLALLGGNFLQPGALPDVLAKLSLLTPNGWALRSFTRIGAAGAGLVDVLPAVGIMVAIGMVCGLAGLRTLGRKVQA